MVDRAELQRDAKKADHADLELADDLRVMMKTKGWERFSALINKHIAERTQNLFNPTLEGGRDVEQHNKGAVYALLWVRDLPSVIVQSADEQIKSTSQPGDVQ